MNADLINTQHLPPDSRQSLIFLRFGGHKLATKSGRGLIGFGQGAAINLSRRRQRQLLHDDER